MQYNLRSNKEARTTDYRGTVKWLDDADLQILERDCARHNKHVREVSRKHGRVIGKLMRIRRKGRGPRQSSFYHTCHHEAKHWDIYYGEDTHAQWLLKREIDSGLSQGELRKIDEHNAQISWLQLLGSMRKDGREIPQWLATKIS